MFKESVSLGIKEHVLFLGPRLDIDEIIGLLDLYVLPSLWEGLPMIILEAMAAGCPVVATNVGGVSTAIQDKYTGRLVKDRSPGQLSEAIINLLKDDDLRRRCVKNGKNYFREKFTAEIMADSYEKIYLS